MSYETVKPLFEDATASAELRNFVALARSDGASQADLDRLAKRMAPVIGVSAALVASSAAATAALGTAPVTAVSAFGAPSSGLTPALGGVLGSTKLGAGAAKVGLLSQLLASASAKVVAVGLSVGAAGIGLYSMATSERPVPPATSQVPVAQPSGQSAASPALPAQGPAPLDNVLEAAQAAPVVAPVTPVAPVAPAIATRVPAGARQRYATPRAAAAAEPVAAVPEQPITDSPVAAQAAGEPSMPKPSELSLIERAEAARAHYEQALAFLAKHEQLYPHGALAQEREVLAIELMLKAGKLTQAEARAERFEDSYPRSAHLPRLHALLSRANPK